MGCSEGKRDPEARSVTGTVTPRGGWNSGWLGRTGPLQRPRPVPVMPFQALPVFSATLPCALLESFDRDFCRVWKLPFWRTNFWSFAKKGTQGGQQTEQPVSNGYSRLRTEYQRIDHGCGHFLFQLFVGSWFVVRTDTVLRMGSMRESEKLIPSRLMEKGKEGIGGAPPKMVYTQNNKQQQERQTINTRQRTDLCKQGLNNFVVPARITLCQLSKFCRAWHEICGVCSGGMVAVKGN